MKILFTLTSYPPAVGGAQNLTHQIARQLSQTHTIQVISFWDKNRTDWLLGTTLFSENTSRDYQFENIPVHLIGLSAMQKMQMIMPTLLYYAKMDPNAAAIAKILFDQLADCVHDSSLIHHVRIGREPLSLASIKLARKNQIPFIMTPVHHPRWKGWRYKVYENIYRDADALIAMTAVEKQYLVDMGVKPQRIHVNGVGPILASQSNPARFLKKHKIDGPLVIFVGQMYPYKGYLQLLAATKQIWRAEPQANFVFIGPQVGNSEVIFKKYADPRIHRLGTVTLNEKTDALAACSLLCLPSTQESFGGVFTEAWSFKKPVIGCNIPSVSEVVCDGEDGYLVSQSSAEIAEKVIFLLNNPSIAKSFGEAGWKKVIHQYTWEKISSRTEQIYLEVLQNG